jgi:hypothetical protein
MEAREAHGWLAIEKKRKKNILWFHHQSVPRERWKWKRYAIVHDRKIKNEGELRDRPF